MRIRRWTIAGLAALTAAPAFLIAGAVPAHAASGPYSGNAYGDLVHVNAVNAPGATAPGIADVHLARSTGDVNSVGLAAPYAGKRSAARATNLDGSVLAGNVNLNPILTTAVQTAPPTVGTPEVKSLTGPVSVLPILALNAATATAQARWGTTDTTCIASGTPISYSKTAVLDADLLNLGDPFGTAVASVTNGTGGAAYSQSTVGLVDVAGQTPKGLKSEVIDQLTGVVLFKGSPNEVTLNVLAPPTLTGVATGHAGTSTVTYSAPVVQVIQGGAVIGELNATSAGLDVQLPPGGAPALVLQLRLGALTKTIADTGVTGDAALLQIKLVDITGTLTLLDTAIAPMTVKATVPVGGVDCVASGPDPLANVQVDASTPTVFPNGQFDYAITVPNTGTCTLTNVKVVFTVTGPDGTKIVSTAPPASTVTDLMATWNDIGPIAPGAVKTLKATIQVPSNAPPGSTFSGTAAVTGTCDGAPAAHTATSGPLPSVGAPSSTACDLSSSSIDSSHREVRIGDEFNEYVRVSNLGKGTCGPTTVTLKYPPDTTFVSCTDGCTHDDGTRTVTWTIPSLGSGMSKDLVATFKVASSARSGEVLGTTVTVRSGSQVVTGKTTLPVVTSANVLNALNQRTRSLLPRTGAELPTGGAFALFAVFLGLRGMRRRRLT